MFSEKQSISFQLYEVAKHLLYNCQNLKFEFPSTSHVICLQVRLGQPDAGFPKFNVLQILPAVRCVKSIENMAKKHQIIWSVIDDQECAIRQLFAENNWDYSNLCKYHFFPLQ